MSKAALPADAAGFNELAFMQFITPPFRAETGMPSNFIPVYAALTPIVPPYTLYRMVDLTPRFSSKGQLKEVLTPENLVFQGR
jgi:hypothetical protein